MPPNGSTELLALFGGDISRSPSPETHTRWAAQAQLNWLYVPIQCSDAAAFQRLVSEMILCGNFRGANITNPLKTAALQLPFAELDSSAQLCQAANTLYRAGDESTDWTWRLANTDLLGCSVTLQKILSDDRARNPHRQHLSCIILGTGAMARTCSIALGQLEAGLRADTQIQLSRAQLGSEMREHLPSELPRSDALLVINTLPSGTSAAADLMATNALRHFNEVAPQARKFLFEISYLKTSLAQTATAQGWHVTRGELLFETQAHESFKLWARQPAPTQATALLQSVE